MKYQHVRRIFRDPFYVNCKKHYCIDCNEQLIKLKISKIVNSNSLEAEDFDFYTGDSYMLGNVKFIWTEFQCPKCKRQFKIEEMKQIERKYSKRNPYLKQTTKLWFYKYGRKRYSSRNKRKIYA